MNRKQTAFIVAGVILSVLIVILGVIFYRHHVLINDVMGRELRGLQQLHTVFTEIDENAAEDAIDESDLLRYAISASNLTNVINEISENTWLYRDYSMKNFNYFIYEEAYAAHELYKNKEEWNKCLAVIREISKELEGIEDLDVRYNFRTDSQKVREKIKRIEKICEEWA